MRMREREKIGQLYAAIAPLLAGVALGTTVGCGSYLLIAVSSVAAPKDGRRAPA